MISFELDRFPGRKALLPETVDDLPYFKGAKQVYLDLETTSNNDDIPSFSPWREENDILGICITVDEYPDAVYIPLRHRYPSERFKNFPIEPAYRWLNEIMRNSQEWINHNIKYDAHFLYNKTDIRWSCKLGDTLTRSKLIDSDRFRYDLASLMNDWLFINIREYELRLKTALGSFKDYAIVGVDTMTQYGASDALAVRELNNYCLDKLHPECQRVWKLETNITPILLQIERNGMKVDRGVLEQEHLAIPTILGKLRGQLREESGIPNFKPNQNKHCEALLCGKYGLPVLERTEKTKNPSFSASALKGYKNRPDAPQKLVSILETWKKYHKLFTSFTKPYLEMCDVNGYLHTDYDQLKSTGRMSSRRPNTQQLSLEAKGYVVPPEGYCILDVDFSQIEFRVIVHYANDQRCIEAYKKDPKTDFHKWVQTMCQLDRPAAKTLNFRLGYGGGKETTALALTTTKDFIQDSETVEEALERGRGIFDNYYKQLPTLKSTRWRASSVLKSRGYCRTILGRHRHLLPQASFKAFNTVCQGTAADLMKDATYRLWWEYLVHNPAIILWGIVHDSWCLYVPLGEEDKVAKNIIEIVERFPKDVELRVPIKADSQVGYTSWRECK